MVRPSTVSLPVRHAGARRGFQAQLCGWFWAQDDNHGDDCTINVKIEGRGGKLVSPPKDECAKNVKSGYPVQFMSCDDLEREDIAMLRSPTIGRPLDSQA